MKKLILPLILVLMVFTFLNAGAQTWDWKWLHMTPQGNALRYIQAIDPNTWYAVGFAGTFMKTTDQGTTWYINHKVGRPFGTSGQYSNLYDAHFFDANTGIAVGSTGSVGRTTDGGVTWDTIPGIPTGATSYQVFFLNNLTGYVAGTSTVRLAATYDGGLTWTLNTILTSATYYDVFAWDSSNVIVASTSGNVMKTTNAGANWTTYNVGASFTIYKIHFIDANTGYVAGASPFFRYTTNGGVNWNAPVTAFPSTSTQYDIDVISSSIAPAPKLFEGFEDTTFPPVGWSVINVLGTNIWNRSTAYFYSGIASAFIQYEYTGGEDWLISKKVSGISADDSLIFWWKNPWSTAYEPDSLLIRVSTTDSLQSSFTNVVASINSAYAPYTWTRFAFSLGAFAGQNIYVAFQHKNTDGAGGYLDDVTIVGPPATQNTVFLTGEPYNIYKTTNNGTTWDTLGILAPVSQQPWTSTYYASHIAPNGDSLVTAGAFGLINARVNASNRYTFTKFQKAGTLYDIWAQSATGTVLAVGGPSIAGGTFDQIMRSTNGGTNWTIISPSAVTNGYFNSIEMIDDNTGYVCGTNSAVYKTTNGGVNWDSVVIPNMTTGLTLAKVDFVNANTGWIFAKTNAGTNDSTIWKTTNAGTTWERQRLSTGTTTTNQIYWSSMIDANTGWVVNYTPRPYMTTDGGATWTVQNLIDGFGGFLYGIHMLNVNTGYCVGSSGRVYKTTDGGTLWDTVTVPTRSYSFYGCKFNTPMIGFVYGATGTTFFTMDGGNTWVTQNTAGATLYGGWLTADNKAFTVSSNAYIFKNTNTLTHSPTVLEEPIPTKYELAQNYPNPFNPTTTIQFALPKAGFVTLKIYDIAGREIMNIFNNQYTNAGVTRYLFDARSLASGVYFYSLIVDNQRIDTKKMVLIK